MGFNSAFKGLKNLVQSAELVGKITNVNSNK